MYDIDALRDSQFPLSANEIYFAHAAISPLPQRVRERVEWAATGLARQPTTFWSQDGMKLYETIRAELAEFVNATGADQIQPVTTTSAALSAVARAIPWEAGDNVIFCDLEFPSNAFPWMGLERLGVEARIVPAQEGGLTLSSVADHVDDHTRLVAVSAIQFFTGHRTNLAAIGAFCRDRDILFAVDAIQAIGHMAIDVKAMQIDVLASGGQKSLLSTPGVGFLYVREGVCATLRPLPIGPNATRDFQHWLDYDLTPLEGAARFAMGTPNLIGLFALQESLHLLQELGVEQIDRHTTALAAEAIAMAARLGYEVITPPGHGPIVTFNPFLSESQAELLVERLSARSVTVSNRPGPDGHPYIRLSFHCYNTAEELRRFEQIWCEEVGKI